MRVFFLGLFLSALLAGCGTFADPSRVTTVVGQNDATEKRAIVVDTDATRRGVYLFKRPQLDGEVERWVIVAEPPPDVALASAVKTALEFAAKTPAVDASGKVNVDVSQTITSLVQRTQAVSILRDALFRLSEAYANGTLDRRLYAEKYDKVLDAARSVANAAERDAEASLAKAEARKNEARTEVLNTINKTLDNPKLEPQHKEDLKGLFNSIK